jgi:LysM repeat protein
MSTLDAELGNIATQTAVAGGGAESAPTQAPPSGGEATDTTTTETAPETPPESTEPPPPPPTNTPVQVPTATPGVPESYQLQKGEFPFCIARRFNVNVAELLSLNGLTSNSLVPVGFTLQIPQTGNTFVGQRALLNHPTDYTVAAGDTIYTIACKFGDVDPMAIAQANGLSAPYNLSAGQSIYIP